MSSDVRPARLTLDCDAAWCYRAIHGVDGGNVDGNVEGNVEGNVDGNVDNDGVLVDGVSRFLDLCARLSTRATLFVVGADLRAPRFAQLIKQAADSGHAIESHSHRHRYDLSRLPPADIRADLDASRAAIAAVTGRAPVGFRAPGYNLSRSLLDAVKDAGFAYSSSLLPSPAYFAARALVIAKTRAAGRRSASLVGTLAAFSPRPPRAHANGLAEFPMSAPCGVPLTGTTLALASDGVAAFLARRAARDDDAQLELHAADFVDGRALPAAQPDAHVRLSDKLRRIEAAARVLAARG